ncbi:hypothetical protein KKG71_03240 [Patescibacteria group bacterium]|nr:hypothetical protein [Patescibacteria group bacterium]
MTLSDVVSIGQIVIWIAIILYYILVYKIKIDKIEKSVGSIDQLKNYISDLSEYLKEWKGVPKYLRCFNAYYTSNSPLQLTASGLDFIKDSGFEAIFKNNKSFFITSLRERLKSKENDNSFFYFCEEYSIQLIMELEEDESHLLSDIRDFIFKRGLSDIKKILFKSLGLYLRDQLIKDFGKEEDFKKLKENELRNKEQRG